MTRRTALLLGFGAFLISACDPSDACDPGYYADHSFCYLVDSGTEPVPDDDAGMAPSKNTPHGTACTKQSDCGGEAPICGAPQLPVCTSSECFVDGADTCPTGWTCLDVTRYPSAALAVTSVCINL